MAVQDGYAVRIVLTFILLLGACARPGDAPSTPVSLPQRPYVALLTQDADGFIETDACDSTLFSGLLGAAGIPVDLPAAEASPGEWYRRPVSYTECYAANESRSTISRDQLLGVLWWAWRNKQNAVVERLAAYAAEHNGVMGTPASETMLNSNMVRLLAEVRKALGGDGGLGLHSPFFSRPEAVDYEAHLQALQILLFAETTGSMSTAMVETLTAFALKQPRNPLFAAALATWAGGDSEAAARLLDDATLWPRDRLPTSADRCEPWLVQRDEGDDWLPCADEARTHSGGDWLFVKSIFTRGQ